MPSTATSEQERPTVKSSTGIRNTETRQPTTKQTTAFQPLPKRLPQPPDWHGVVISLSMVSLCLALYLHGLLGVQLAGPHRSSLLHIAAVFFSLEYLYTGLVVTTHDATHGSLCPRHPRLNHFIGTLSSCVNGWVHYPSMRRKHMEHHAFTGIVGKDPDFHGGDPDFWVWLGKIIREYITVWQCCLVNAELALTLLVCRVPFVNWMLFKLAANLLSTLRVFAWGIYVPHHPNEPDEVMNWEKSRSSDQSRIMSMLRCYCFDYHWEHHRWPYAPWWQLGDYKALMRQGKIAA